MKYTAQQGIACRKGEHDEKIEHDFKGFQIKPEIQPRCDRMDIDKYFSDYEAFTENEIADISAQGITLKNGTYIDFDVCAEVWAKVNSLEKSKCVGEREITDWSFTFYSLPKPIMIKFIEKGRMAELFSKNNTRRRFCNLQLKINELGYKTFDMT